MGVSRVFGQLGKESVILSADEVGIMADDEDPRVNLRKGVGRANGPFLRGEDTEGDCRIGEEWRSSSVSATTSAA